MAKLQLVKPCAFLGHSVDRRNRSIGVTCARDEETKKERRTKKPYCGKLGIHPDHRSDRNQKKFTKIGLSGFRHVAVEIFPFPLLWSLAYTTACTTLQAVNHPKADGWPFLGA